jgi:hypothetical protein
MNYFRYSGDSPSNVALLPQHLVILYILVRVDGVQSQPFEVDSDNHAYTDSDWQPSLFAV